MASLVLTDSSQLTSDSQHLALRQKKGCTRRANNPSSPVQRMVEGDKSGWTSAQNTSSVMASTTTRSIMTKSLPSPHDHAILSAEVSSSPSPPQQATLSTESYGSRLGNDMGFTNRPGKAQQTRRKNAQNKSTNTNDSTTPEPSTSRKCTQPKDPRTIRTER
uniref:(California timema) hypothetical protein n=1 Tax=Timema californicum TaxID=61474 RepID=A0A7R9P9T3_TIMCA|nr:unnamed protein product [Timema californicum]